MGGEGTQIPDKLEGGVPSVSQNRHLIYGPVLLLKIILNSRPECKRHTLFLTKMAKINIILTTKKNENPVGSYLPI